MGPYVAVNAVLIGFFGFAAIYHVVLWSQSRRDTVLIVFAVHCLLCALISANLLALAMAETVGAGQRALDLRTNLATLAQVSRVWRLSLITGVRARWFVWSITGFFAPAAIVNMTIVPLAGLVTSLERVTTSWGEQVSLLHRGSPTGWFGPVYGLALSINAFG